MKLEPVVIAGFRGYRKRRQLPIDQLTAFITEGESGFIL